MIGALGFSAPWLLLGLLALPALWWLLRAVPPAPIRRRFPAVALLIGLEDKRIEARKTPLWLVLLRMAVAALVIVGLSGPILNPDKLSARKTPLIVLIDSHWPAAPDWAERVALVDQLLGQAEQSGQPALVALSHQLTAQVAAPVLAPAAIWRERLAAATPAPWDAPYDLTGINTLPAGRTIWVSDGLAREGRREALTLREGQGPVEVYETGRAVLGLTPAELVEGQVRLTALRNTNGPSQSATLRAFGRDPAGQMRALFGEEVTFVAGNTRAELTLSPPPELRHRVERFELWPQGGLGALSSGQVALVGEALTRRRVALIGAQATETLALLSPAHFLRAALDPSAEIIETADLGEVLRASPHVIILPDVAEISEPDQRAFARWVAEGGVLLRFAGPRLAAAQAGQGGGYEDVLLPVRLRGRGRTVGGAMSWGAPQHIAPFPPDGPFAGLEIPEDVSVTRQVLAEPGPDLSARTLARLADGTPLVTRKPIGAGQVVLIHVGANAEWSNLVLSGMFVQMLERLTASAAGPATALADPLSEEGQIPWRMELKLTAQGQLQPETAAPAVSQGKLSVALREGPGADVLPGVYAHEARREVVNTLTPEHQLQPADWPARIVPTWGGLNRIRDLSGGLLAAALVLLAVDIVATLWVAGRLAGLRSGKAARSAVVLLALSLAAPHPADAQVADGAGSDQTRAAAAEVTLAYVLTGDAELDALSRAGLTGLSEALFARSSVEPAAPVGVDLEHDEISVFPFLYWPVAPNQPIPQAVAYERLRQYLAGGGLILFDTRDAGTGGGDARGRKLQALAGPLSLPQLDPIPYDHVLTRAFYLIDSFPGRYSGPVWAEAAPPGAEADEGMPFRQLNDGVTPVIIGGNDWAGAWAVDASGAPLMPIGRGQAGERQREMALRFGINLVMHVLTGNYKSDQVHVPALLQRLGQ